ncbi:MAG: hypothetical protein DHS20C10_14220 [marine bacterium B5-7]|nr:MAG: hypothetical protein DHS20C10_14220 [marine bacterium B5-7]
MLVDSHCHLDRLDLTKYDGDLSAAMAAAEDNQISHMLCVCIDLENFSAIHAIAQQYENVFVSVGVHPTEKDGREPKQEELVHLAKDPLVVAIGETGLDYFHCPESPEWQRDRFRCHIRAAKEAKKPLIIHSRGAKEDTLKLMFEEGANEVGGVMHCFTEDWDMAERAMSLGFYISFSGIVTFKSAKTLQDVAMKMPLDRILIETDSPYLAPDPFRGKTNEPAYVRYVAEKVAALREDTVDNIAKATTENFFKLFKDFERERTHDK